MIERHQQVGDSALFDQFLDSARRNFLACFCNHLTGFCINQIIGRARATYTIGEERRDPALLLVQLVRHRVVVGVHDCFLVQTQRIQQGCHRQFAATVDAGEDDVLGVELKVQPAAAIRDDAAGKQKLARRMRFAFVMVKEHTGRTVHLGHDHTLGAVHDEGTVRRHQGHVAHEHVLFLDVLDRLGAGVLINIKHDQTQSDLQRCAIGHVALHAFFDVVFGFFQIVFHELQNGGFVEILDRENRLKHAFDAFAVCGLFCIAGAQE